MTNSPLPEFFHCMSCDDQYVASDIQLVTMIHTATGQAYETSLCAGCDVPDGYTVYAASFISEILKSTVDTSDGEGYDRPMTNTSHANCTHDNTKAARAKCRRDRANAAPKIETPFVPIKFQTTAFIAGHRTTPAATGELKIGDRFMYDGVVHTVNGELETDDDDHRVADLTTIGDDRPGVTIFHDLDKWDEVDKIV